MRNPKKEMFFVATKDGRYFLSIPAPGSKIGWCLVDEKCGYEGGIIDGVAVEASYISPGLIPEEIYQALLRLMPEHDDEGELQVYMSVVGKKGDIEHAVIADGLCTRAEAMRVLISALKTGWFGLAIIEYQ